MLFLHSYQRPFDRAPVAPAPAEHDDEEPVLEDDPVAQLLADYNQVKDERARGSSSSYSQTTSHRTSS